MYNSNLFSEIGSINCDIKNDILKLKLNVDIDITKNEFIFIKINSEFIPFKILSLKSQRKYIELTTKDTDIIDKRIKNLKAFLKNEDFNKSVTEKSNVNIVNFTILNNKNEPCGKIINLYKNNGKTYIEIERDSKIITVYKNKEIFKKIDVNNNTISITDKDLDSYLM